MIHRIILNSKKKQKTINSNRTINNSIKTTNSKFPIEKNNDRKKNNAYSGDLKVALCAIAKLENKYLSEWVDYYINLGFDHIYLYDNNEIDGERLKDILSAEQLKYITISEKQLGKKSSGTGMQLEAYNECYRLHCGEYTWIAFFDIDEFLYLTEHKDIKSYLSESIFNEYQGIKINWLCYTDNNQLYYEDKPVQKRFTEKCAANNRENYFIKTIFRTNIPNFRMNNPHYNSNAIKLCDNCGKKVTYSHTCKLKYVNYELACLKHYATKSTEEYINIKRKRRGPGVSKNRLSLDLYWRYNNKTKEKIELLNKLFTP